MTALAAGPFRKEFFCNSCGVQSRATADTAAQCRRAHAKMAADHDAEFHPPTDVAPLDANGDIVPCRYVHGEMVPLTKAEIAENHKIKHGSTSYAGARGKAAGYRLSKDEKCRIFTQTGQRFEDHGQYKAWCRANGMRDVERGEYQDTLRKDMAEWQRGGCQGEKPHDFRRAGSGRKPIPTPWRETG